MPSCTAWAPACCCARPLAQAQPSLVQLAPPSVQLNTQIWILTHPDLKQVARIRAFTQFLFDALSVDARLAHWRAESTGGAGGCNWQHLDPVNRSSPDRPASNT
jgi:hypothetical protein